MEWLILLWPLSGVAGFILLAESMKTWCGTPIWEEPTTYLMFFPAMMAGPIMLLYAHADYAGKNARDPHPTASTHRMTNGKQMIAEGYPGQINARAPATLSRAWAKRAATIQSKAEALFSEMLEVVGADDPLTDRADNIVNDAAEIGDMLFRGRVLRRVKGGRHG